jgi:hypothetical protein
MGSDASTTPGPYELDMPRYEMARARFFEDYESFQGWRRQVSMLMLEHCMRRCGYEDVPRDDLTQIYNAYASGDIRIGDFQFAAARGKESSERLLKETLDQLQADGIRSRSASVARDSLLMASDLLQALNSEDMPRIVERADVVKDAAIDFMYASDSIRDSARVALSLRDLSVSIPSVSDVRVGPEIVHSLMTFVGNENSALNGRVVSTLAAMSAATMFTRA